jgi:large subunit ribosomal protein L29
MKSEEIREMDDTTIRSEIGSLEKELMSLRMGNTIGTTENPLLIRFKKRDVARMKTVLHERQLNIR